MSMEHYIAWWVAVILLTKKQLVDLGSEPLKLKEIASVDQSFLGRKN